VERKRHLGNDVVMLLFRDPECTTPLNPAIFKSQFNRTHLTPLSLTSLVSFCLPDNGRRVYHRAAGHQQARPLSVPYLFIHLLSLSLSLCMGNVYSIAVATKSGVPAFGPPLPADASVPRSDALRQFLLTKRTSSSPPSRTCIQYNIFNYVPYGIS
jgi:hypothetical protein